MAVHVDVPVRRTAEIPLRALLGVDRIGIGASIGLAGGVLLAVPLVLYDWARAGHTALELPMAVTGWIFGLEHFVQNGYRSGPIVVGIALLVAYSVLSGLAFAGLADRVFRVKTLAGSLVSGIAWGIFSFLFCWDMLLPIAHEGAPLRPTAISTVSVAPTWVWVVGFLALGLGTGLAYRALRMRVPE